MTHWARRNLVGAWCPAVSGSDGFLLRDLSGNGYHGTLTNMDPATDWVTNNGYQALDFDGSNDGIVTPAIPFFPNITAVCWLVTGAVSTNASLKTIVAQHTVDGSASNFYLYRNFTNVLTVDVPWVAGGVANSGAYTLADSVYTMVAFTRSGSTGSWTYRIWSQGANRSSTTNASNPNTGSHFFRISRFGTTGTGNCTNNVVLDCRLYGEAMTDSQLSDLSNGGPGYGLRPERRRKYYFAGGPAFKPYWVRRQSQVIGGGVS